MNEDSKLQKDVQSKILYSVYGQYICPENCECEWEEFPLTSTVTVTFYFFKKV